VPCDAKDPDQSIGYDNATGHITSASGLCVDAADCKQVPTLVLAVCDPTAPTQKWVHSANNNFASVGCTAQCIDCFYGGTGNPGLYTCDDTSNQYWVPTGATFSEDYAGKKCMSQAPAKHTHTFPPPGGPLPQTGAVHQHGSSAHAPPPSPACPIGCLPGNHGLCLCASSIAWSVGFDTDMVLQRAGGPAGTAATAAAVYGLVYSPDAKVIATVSDESGVQPPYTVTAVVALIPEENRAPTNQNAEVNYTASFKAMLKPHKTGGSFTITAVCVSGCFNNASRDSAPPIYRATFGDVYVCSGQSNMALSLIHTFAAKSLQAAMRTGAYSQLRFFAFGGMSNALPAHNPVWVRPDGAVTYDNVSVTHSTRPLSWFNASFGASIQPHCCYSHTHVSQGPFMDFSATCMEFGRQLIEQLGNETAPPIGLIQSAVGGTTIEAWSPNSTTALCTVLVFDRNLRPRMP
jgi:hypothetical protein